MVETPTISLHKGKDAQKRAYQTTIIVVETENALDAMGKVIIQIIRMEKRKIIFAQPAMELNNVQLAMEKDSDKKEKVTPLLVLLKELIVEKGFDPALMDEPFLIDQINTFDKDKRVYSKDEANNILNMIWYNGIDSGRIVFAKYNRHKHESSLEKQPFDKPTEYNTIDNIINSTVKRNHLQSKHFWKQDCLVSKKNPLKMSNNSFILLSLAILFSIWMGCIYLVSTYGNQDAIRYGSLGGGGIFTGILIAIAQKWK